MSDISARKQVPRSVLRPSQMRPCVPHDLYQWLAKFQKGQATALFSPSNLRLCMPGIHLSIWGLLTQPFTYVQQIWVLKYLRIYLANSATQALWPHFCDSLPCNVSSMLLFILTTHSPQQASSLWPLPFCLTISSRTEGLLPKTNPLVFSFVWPLRLFSLKLRALAALPFGGLSSCQECCSVGWIP